MQYIVRQAATRAKLSPSSTLRHSCGYYLADRGTVQMIHLTRIDPARNMARFYTMALQPTLFGEWALLKEWGWIGSAGRLVSSRFASEEEAALAMAGHLKAKLSKGYEAV